MRFVAARFFQVFIIELDDSRIFMGLTHRKIPVFGIQCFCPLGFYVYIH